ncbi:hypothetical protein F2Q69_00012520 [Brassica cretica]|uniref:Uncharacterized protein n=1 Tax=Brassica cretica TaxID=69181 RepID=A0A8S9QNS3_BRACR|nr:hypothetical protein F2Q69_00012520 [Brassica cretica]
MDEINEMFYGYKLANYLHGGDEEGHSQNSERDRHCSTSIDRQKTTQIDRQQTITIARLTPSHIDRQPPGRIDRHQSATPHTIKSQPDFHTKEEIDQLVQGIYRALVTTEERLDGRCDDIYFPMDLTISALTSKVEAIQGELVEIQSYIACGPEASISIDRRINKSIDTNHSASIDIDTNQSRLVPKTTSNTSNTPYHGKEISADTYAALTRHQFNHESLIGNALVPVDFHVLDIKLNWNSFLLLGRAFLSIVGAVCNLQTNQLCLTLIDPNAHYDPIPVKKPQTISRRINDAGIIAACHCGDEYEIEYSESIETHTATSIDRGHQKSTDTAYYKTVNTDFNRVREGDYSIGSWTDEPHHESFAVETITYTPGADKLQDSFTDGELLNMQKRDDTDQDPNGFAKAIDGRTLHVSREDIADILQIANGADNLFMHQCSNREHKTTKEFYDTAAYICLPEHASQFTQTKLAPEIYTKDEINEMFYGVCGEHDRNKEAFRMKLDGVYYPLNDSICWLTTCREEMKKDIARIQNATDVARPPSIDRHHHKSIDNYFTASIDINPPHPHTMKSQLEFHTREEID